MYKKTERPLPDLDNAMQLHPSSLTRLRESWAERFRHEVMPLLLKVEDRFAGMYPPEGRPNRSVAEILGILLLAEMHDLPDQKVLDAVSFDIQFQYALRLRGDEAYLSRRSLVGFRTRLVSHDPEGKLLRSVFDEVFEVAGKALNLSTKQQRLDSTFITSNLRVRGRLGLFRQTLRKFVGYLEKNVPERLDRLSPELLAWYASFDDSWEEVKEKTPAIRKEIKMLAGWLYEVVVTFAEDELVASQEPYALVERVVREQCVITQPAQDPAHKDGEGGGGPDAGDRPRIEVHEALRVKGGAMRSPHDPDAATGKKGVGYSVHLTETCNNGDADQDYCPELITDYEVHSADRPDTGRATAILERLDERGRRPDVLFTDGGYPTPESLVAADALRTRLHAPVRRPHMRDDVMSRQDFEFDPDTGEVLQCPTHHAPIAHRYRTIDGKPALHAFFDSDTCRACPKLEICPVQSDGRDRPNSPFRLSVAPGLRLRDRNLEEQRTQEWRDQYSIRAGSEALASEMKRAHGLGELRVRGKFRVLLAVALKATACNIKRWLRQAIPKRRPPGFEVAFAQ